MLMKLASDDMTVVAVKVLTKPAMLLIYYTYLSEIFFFAILGQNTHTCNQKSLMKTLK